MIDNNCKKASNKKLKSRKEKIKYKFQTKFSLTETENYKDWFEWGVFKSYFKFNFNCWGYFDPRPQLCTNITSIIVLLVLIGSLLTLTITWFHLLVIPFLFFGYGDFYLKLPFNTGKIDASENPSYGFYMYHIDPVPKKINFPKMFIWEWGNYNSFDLPWARTWVRTSILLNNNSWEHETKSNRKNFYEDAWKAKQYKIEYDFLDKSDNTIIPTTVYVEEREWRQHWLKWTSLFARVVRSIDVNFSKEVGPRKGSYKGGTIGCSYCMKKGETALECIKRMEKERNFK